jgi:pimeloyl-ACP methyl ester carboxylesterase
MIRSSLRAANAARLFAAANAARLFAAALAALLLAACASPPPLDGLPALQIDPQRVAVAGLSSGAYMATQAHLAWGERIHGAALIAGGPYHCAQGSLQRALAGCTKVTDELPEADRLAAVVRARADRGELAVLDALAGDRVLVLHGRRDALVAPALAGVTVALYAALNAGVSTTLDFERDFGHGMPTLDQGGDCAAPGSPYIGRCGFDAAETVFAALFGPAPGPADEAGGELRRFDQLRYARDELDPMLADAGLLYLPPDCADGARCGLLVVFHGCEQSVEKIGQTFVEQAGFNRWADAHRVAVLYPQTRSSYMPLNPKGCWDWWGYTGPDYDTRRGAQLRWLDAAMTALGVAGG